MSWSSVLHKDCFRSGAGDLMLGEGPCPGLLSFARTASGQVLVT